MTDRTCYVYRETLEDGAKRWDERREYNQALAIASQYEIDIETAVESWVLNNYGEDGLRLWLEAPQDMRTLAMGPDYLNTDDLADLRDTERSALR